jgi:hypothetical protein
MSRQRGTRTEPLYVDLVPSTAWFANLRAELSASEWQRVKDHTFASSNHLCQACGSRGKKHPVECHERWHFDLASGVQTFVKTVSLCPMCHRATHLGFTSTLGERMEQYARWHLARVNDWEPWMVEEHIQAAFEDWGRRSAMSWRLDASALIGFVELSAKTLGRLAEPTTNSSPSCAPSSGAVATPAGANPREK